MEKEIIFMIEFKYIKTKKKSKRLCAVYNTFVNIKEVVNIANKELIFEVDSENDTIRNNYM